MKWRVISRASVDLIYNCQTETPPTDSQINLQLEKEEDVVDSVFPSEFHLFSLYFFFFSFVVENRHIMSPFIIPCSSRGIFIWRRKQDFTFQPRRKE